MMDNTCLIFRINCRIIRAGDTKMEVIIMPLQNCQEALRIKPNDQSIKGKIQICRERLV